MNALLIHGGPDAATGRTPTLPHRIGTNPPGAVTGSVGRPSGRQAVLAVLARAADDQKFLARMADNSSAALQEYDLTSEQRAALSGGDQGLIESWVGKLDARLCTWLWCRLAQEKW